MKTKVQEWGDSLAIRIPKAFADAAHLHKDTVINLMVIDGKLMISALTTAPLTLNELLAGITEDNIHREIDTGSSVGNEK
jgi:antitoxin MazE